MAFSFSFAGDDIDLQDDQNPTNNNASVAFAATAPPHQPPTSSSTQASSAFPIPGKPQLPPIHHPLSQLIAQLPSKIAYTTLDVSLDDGSVMQIPRRELWDVRVQLMAEDEGSSGGDGDGDGSVAEGLGKVDVKTGVYEGGFKSWESSVDLVKSLATENVLAHQETSATRVIEVSLPLPHVVVTTLFYNHYL
jgi:protein-histidine N-methyltransferase